MVQVWAQTIPEEYEGTTYRGDFQNIARGVLDGNLIETNFRNHGELSRWGDIPWGVWPRNIGGRHIDGVGVVVAGYVPSPDLDITPITSLEDYREWLLNGQNARNDTLLNPVIINYREAGVRQSPYTGAVWGWLPLPGFNNPERRDSVTGNFAPIPALSNDASSWPEFWPDRLQESPAGWPDSWNGRDGRFASADLESYYVMDDFSDLEYNFGIEITDPVTEEVLPLPHSPLGVYMPSPFEDPTMGGFGLQTQVRVFQWANILAEDTMFLIYRITNKGEYSQDRLYFVQIVDYGLGQDENDDNASYDPILDVVFGWDSDGVGDPAQAGQAQYELGYTGFAFLESPANDNNGLDDDQDGITDESRFNENFIVVESGQGISAYAEANYNMTDFTNYYGSITDRPAFTAEIWFTTDENLDWVGFSDDNDNGTADPGEVLNNDVGRDGLGLFDLEYPGPDEGEGDGLPTPGEPNYNELDVDESDQIGLRGFDLGTRPFYESGNNLRDDTWLFERIAASEFPLGQPSEQEVSDDEPFFLFMSGEVQLASQSDLNGKSTDFFSTAWIFGNDLDDFLKNRRTVQSIYNADYSFAQPPVTPRLTAVAGDNRVVLSWDTLSIRSFDRFLQDFDFEGYKLYKGTDVLFTDARTITDVNGTPTFYRPIARWDLDNNISGLVNVLDGEASYDLGSNTGLAFNYVDTEVQNGKQYYYAIVAYDRGLIAEPGASAPGIDPQENTFRVAISPSGQITGTSKNAAAVIPSPPPAGYTTGGATVDLSNVTSGTGTGFAEVNVVVETELNENYEYRISFGDAPSTRGDYRETTSYRVEELTQPQLVVGSTEYASSTAIINGFTVNLYNDEPGQIVEEKTGWVSNEGQENEIFSVDPTLLDGLATNWTLVVDDQLDAQTSSLFVTTDSDYEIVFVDPADSTYRPPRYLGGGFSRISVPVFAKNITKGTVVEMLIRDNDDNDEISAGDQIVVLEEPARNQFEFRFAVTINPVFGESVAPSIGDKIRITTTRQFGSDDRFQFGVIRSFTDDSLAVAELDDIYVVPNPYVGASSFERFSSSVGRGERKISFFNVPRYSTIRIFNIRGELIRTLDTSNEFNEGIASWDLQTNNSEDVAYGVYFYHVTAYSGDGSGTVIGEYTDKFAIIK
jgi:hypothetical protein